VIVPILALLFSLAMTALAVGCVRRNLRRQRVFPDRLYLLGLKWSPVWLEAIANSIFLAGALLFSAIFLLMALQGF
jgi:hypothetical protein